MKMPSMPLFVKAARAANVERVKCSVFARRCERGGLDANDVAALLAFQARASSGFVPFLEALAERCPEGPVRQALCENLREETEAQPCPHAEWAKRTHAALLESLSLSREEQLRATLRVAHLADGYLLELEELLSPRLTPTEAAAAFALAVEDAVPTLYSAFLDGLRNVPGVKFGDLAFFEAHVACDVDHASRILEACLEASVVDSLARSPDEPPVLRWRAALDCASTILQTRVEALNSIFAASKEPFRVGELVVPQEVLR